MRTRPTHLALRHFWVGLPEPAAALPLQARAVGDRAAGRRCGKGAVGAVGVAWGRGVCAAGWVGYGACGGWQRRSEEKAAWAAVSSHAATAQGEHTEGPAFAPAAPVQQVEAQWGCNGNHHTQALAFLELSRARIAAAATCTPADTCAASCCVSSL